MTRGRVAVGFQHFRGPCRLHLQGEVQRGVEIRTNRYEGGLSRGNWHTDIIIP